MVKYEGSRFETEKINLSLKVAYLQEMPQYQTINQSSACVTVWCVAAMELTTWRQKLLSFASVLQFDLSTPTPSRLAKRLSSHFSRGRPLGHFQVRFGVAVISSTVSWGGVHLVRCPRKLVCLLAINLTWGNLNPKNICFIMLFIISIYKTNYFLFICFLFIIEIKGNTQNILQRHEQ